MPRAMPKVWVPCQLTGWLNEPVNVETDEGPLAILGNLAIVDAPDGHGLLAIASRLVAADGCRHLVRFAEGVTVWVTCVLPDAPAAVAA